MARTYVYPRFSTLGAFGFRTGGPGLGNLLFPYARAMILARHYGFVPINPSWATVKLGTFLRKERDKRLYLQLFNRQGITGWRKTMLLLTRRKVDERELARGEKGTLDGAVVTTTGLGHLFRDIADEREYVASRVARLLRLEDNMHIRAFGPVGIGVHVRLGDFGAHQRTPLAWYVATIEKIRRAVGKDVPVSVASDGSDAELVELLRLPNTRRLHLGAPAELFALSSAKVVLASNSTFSAWAAFLGHVPILWERRDSSLEGIFVDGMIDEVLPAEAPLPPRLAEYLRREFK